MSERKVNLLKIPGFDKKLFEDVFCAYVKTGREESEGIISDYSGSLEPDGHFVIVHRGKDPAKRTGYEAKLEGRFEKGPDGDSTAMQYYTEMSRVTLVCFVVFAAVFAAFLGWTLVNYFTGNPGSEIYGAIFFGIGFFAMLPGVVLRLECRSLEKALDKIVGEYASVLEKKNVKD